MRQCVKDDANLLLHLSLQFSSILSHYKPGQGINALPNPQVGLNNIFFRIVYMHSAYRLLTLGLLTTN